MKQLISTYKFFPSEKKVVFKETISLDQLLLITNTTTGTIVYNFAAPAKGGAISGKTLTLDHDTTAMNSADLLQIYADVPEKVSNSLTGLLLRILQTLSSPLGFDKSLSRQRGTVVVESGTITQVSLVPTVTTVTNLSQIDTIQGRLLVNGANYSAWAATNRERIS